MIRELTLAGLVFGCGTTAPAQDASRPASDEGAYQRALESSQDEARRELGRRRRRADDATTERKLTQLRAETLRQEVLRKQLEQRQVDALIAEKLAAQEIARADNEQRLAGERKPTAAAESAAERRRQLAAVMEAEYLDSGADIDEVFTSGASDTALVVQSRGCSRRITWMIKKQLGKDLAKIGFDRVQCTNGYQSWFDALP